MIATPKQCKTDYRISPMPGSQLTRNLLLGIWGHLSRRRRIQLGLLLVVMLASGGAELVSLGAVLPFLAARVGFTAAVASP